MVDVDELVRRTVTAITAIARRVGRFAGRLLAIAIVVCVGSFLLGVAALSDGIETVWIVLSIVFGSIAIGGAASAWWKARTVRRHTAEIADEVRALAARDGDGARTVIETFEAGEAGTGSSVVVGRQFGGASFGGFRSVSVGPDLRDSKRLSAAASALTRFPLQMLATALITGVFGFLGLLFALALAL